MSRKKKTDGIPILRVPKNATMKQIYAAARKAFTADDLAKFANEEKMVPARQVLAELEALSQETESGKKRKS